MIRNIALWAACLGLALLVFILREERLFAQGKIPSGRLRRLWLRSERRRAPRYRVNWSVRYRRSQGQPPARGQTRDVSQTGAGLTLSEKVPPGSQLDLEVPVPGRQEPLRLTAIVVWAKEVIPSSDAQGSQRNFFVGIHFQNLNSTLQQELGFLLNNPDFPKEPERPSPDSGPVRSVSAKEQAALYAAFKRRFWLADWVLTFALFCLLIWSGAARGWDSWVRAHVSHWPVQVAAYTGLFWLILLPLNFLLDWARGFRLEHRFGLSTQGFGDWLGDYAKQLALGAAFGLLVVEGLSLLLRLFPNHWWLWAAAAWMASSILLARVFPTLLIPLFYRQQPLPEGSLRRRLETLLARCGTRVHGIFEVNLSRTTRKGNACLCGMGKSRRVLVSDTLLSRYPEEEIEVVLAHELGHHRRHHIGILIAVSAIGSAFSCFAVDLWAKGWLPRLGLSGLAELSALPVIGLGLFLAGLALQPVTQGLSRRLERQADQFALEQTGNPAAFIATMRRLAEQNLAEENPPRWVEWLLYDHPPIRKRIALAEKFGASRG